MTMTIGGVDRDEVPESALVSMSFSAFQFDMRSYSANRVKVSISCVNATTQILHHLYTPTCTYNMHTCINVCVCVIFFYLNLYFIYLRWVRTQVPISCKVQTKNVSWERVGYCTKMTHWRISSVLYFHISQSRIPTHTYTRVVNEPRGSIAIKTYTHTLNANKNDKLNNFAADSKQIKEKQETLCDCGWWC